MNYYNFLSTHADNPAFKAESAELITGIEPKPFRLDYKGFTEIGYSVAILRDDFGYTFSRIATELGLSEFSAKQLYAQGLR